MHALLDIGTGDQLLGHSPCDPPAHLNMCALFNDVGYLSLMAPCPRGVATGDEVPGLLLRDMPWGVGWIDWGQMMRRRWQLQLSLAAGARSMLSTWVKALPTTRSSTPFI